MLEKKLNENTNGTHQRRMWVGQDERSQLLFSFLPFAYIFEIVAVT
jgi:hypothetical protein